VEAWLDKQPNIDVLYINYNETLADPAPAIERINRFLGDRLDTAAMAEVVDSALYRNKSGESSESAESG
jgi:hypothetical protein